MSQRELSEALKVTDKAISSYEVGRTTPRFTQLNKISKILNKPIDYFSADSDFEELDLQIKIRDIERDLAEIKKILQQRDSRSKQE